MGRLGGGQKAPDRHPCPDGQMDMPEWVQTPQVNAKYDVVMKLSVFGARTDTHTHTRQNLYILATRAVKKID